MNFNQIFSEFNNLRALILGDSMVDAYYYGEVDRISPEAPVPIVNLRSKEHRLGGAANVALNIKALGATPVLCSLRGADEYGGILEQLCKDAQISPEALITDSERLTTVKTRIIGNNNQMLRIDEEDTHTISTTLEDQVMDVIERQLEQVDVVIFQDYNKGLLSKGLIQRVIKSCKEHQVKTVVDPKFDHFFDYKGVDLFKPNRKEIAQAYNIARFNTTQEVINLASQLCAELNAGKVLITLSEEGVAMVDSNQTTHLPAHPRKVVDVSGAGDSALSAAALCLALNSSDRITSEIANLAGGLVCERTGVVPIDRNALLDELLAMNFK